MDLLYLTYYSRILIDGQQFHTTEQYYQFQKAKFAKDEERAKEILESSEPRIAKKIGDRVQVNMAKWREKSLEIMKNALEAKFTQNAHLRDALLETRPATLVECSAYDHFWACGLGLFAKDLENRDSWKGDNRLGILLTELRIQLSS